MVSAKQKSKYLFHKIGIEQLIFSLVSKFINICIKLTNEPFFFVEDGAVPLFWIHLKVKICAKTISNSAVLTRHNWHRKCIFIFYVDDMVVLTNLRCALYVNTLFKSLFCFLRDISAGSFISILSTTIWLKLYICLPRTWSVNHPGLRLDLANIYFLFLFFLNCGPKVKQTNGRCLKVNAVHITYFSYSSCVSQSSFLKKGNCFWPLFRRPLSYLFLISIFC